MDITIHTELRRLKACLLRPYYKFKLQKDYCERYFGNKLQNNANDISISFAGALPSQGVLVTGGSVKLVELSQYFPDTKVGFNLVYIASSALPEYPKLWVRYCKKTGIKLVVNMNGVAYPGWAGKKYKDINNPFRTLLKHADYVIYQSNFSKLSADNFVYKRKNAFDIIHNPVDTSFYKPLMSSKNGNEIFTILVMGSHHYKERVSLALETLKALVDKGVEARLIIAGRLAWDKKAEDQVQCEILSLGLQPNVTIIGAYQPDQALAFIHQAHVLLHLQYNDVCPTVVLEAMACGLPVVCSMSGGVPELVTSNVGICIPVIQNWDKYYYPDKISIAEALLTINKNYELFSIKARETAVRCFDKSLWIERHRYIFDKLFNG